LQCRERGREERGERKEEGEKRKRERKRLHLLFGCFSENYEKKKAIRTHEFGLMVEMIE
jgi:hypothetical protein